LHTLRPPARRLRPLVWPLVLVGVAAAIYLAARAKRDLTDFRVYQTAGARALAAEPLYRAEDGHFQFKYLPAFAIAMAPLGHLDPEVAKGLWYALSFGLLIVFMRESLHLLPDRRAPERRLLWVTVLVMARFYIRELTLGQTNILLGVLFVGSLGAAGRQRPWLAGSLAGLAVFVKPYAVVLAPWLGLTAGFSAAAAFAGVVAAGLVAPAAVYGWQGNLHLLAAWLQTVTQTTEPNLLMPENVSFAGTWARWVGPGRAASLLAAATSLAALGLAVGVWRQRGRVRQPAYLEVALLMLLVPVVSPQGWDYMLLLATPALICLVDRWHDLAARWRAIVIVAIVAMVFPVRDVLGLAAYRQVMGVAVVGVSASALAVVLARLRWRALA
jgi:Glycosyltransferase family 87